jgi:DNA polymerase
MTNLLIDIETYSNIDLSKCGVYKYVEDPSFEILLFAYKLNDQPAVCVDLTKYDLPYGIYQLLHDPKVLKIAHNAAFERACLAKFYGEQNPAYWHCTMIHAMELGLPAGLENIGTVLKLSAKKNENGKTLINYFSKPCKPTKTNGNRTRNLPDHSPEKWEQFTDYCIQDVITEYELYSRLQKFPLPETEQKLWQLDQKINDRGVEIETDLVNNAIKLSNQISDILLENAKQLTGLENPNSVAQLKKWLELQGIEVEGLDKNNVTKILNKTEIENVIKVLEIRQQLSKSSIKKYESMASCVNSDNHARGLFQFYGAARTGRWAGRRIQLQNMPQNHMSDLDECRTMLLNGDFSGLKNKHDNIPGVLSQLIRTAIIPADGHKFLVSDFSAIEARVLAWLADETWRLDVFKTHGKIYEAAAARMFDVPIESINKEHPLRQKGKISELALGYGGGVGALLRMGALEMGLKEEELQPLVDIWRKANKKIVKLWYDMSDAAFKTVQTKGVTRVRSNIEFSYDKGILFLKLPSGRKLAYVKPHVIINKKGYNELCFMAQEMGGWVSTKIWSGQWVENLVQGCSRDLLAEAMLRINEAGIDIVGHVHDEVICEVLESKMWTIDKLNVIMRVVPEWAKDLPLNADGFECRYYQK